MKDRTAQLIEKRKHLAEQMPDPSSALTGSLMSRMVRCNKPNCRRCRLATAVGILLRIRESGCSKDPKLLKSSYNLRGTAGTRLPETCLLPKTTYVGFSLIG